MFNLALFDWIDGAAFILVLIFGVFLWKDAQRPCMVWLIIVVLLGLVLPSWSVIREIDRVVATWNDSEIHDNYELLYVYFRFPVYWLMAFVPLVGVLVSKKVIEGASAGAKDEL